MRAWAVLLAVGMALAGSEARAQSAGVERAVSDPERLAPFGLMLDAGATEGSGLSVALRASRHVRLHLGATYNGLRMGGRVGLSLLPVRSRLAPTVTLEVGHARPASVEALTRRLVDRTQPPASALERVGYTYASAHLGLELEVVRGCTFFVRGGASVMRLDVPSLERLDGPFLQGLGPREARGGSLHTVLPTAKLGLVAYFG